MGEVCRGSGTNYECYLSPTRVPQGQASYFRTDEETLGLVPGEENDEFSPMPAKDGPIKQ